MKIAITGGAGFIGSHLSELLIKKKTISKIVIIDISQSATTFALTLAKNQATRQV